jgi:membrane fusion protein (multidrug efflux system)
MSTDTQTTPNPNKRRAVLAGITVAFIVASVGYGAYYLLVASKHAETDNAYVGGNLVNVSSQVTGSVIEIGADETQMVRAGTELVRLDPADAAINLAQAEARLGTAVRQQRERYTNVAQYEAMLAQRRVAVKTAQEDLARRAPLAADNVVSGEEVAHARRAVDDAQAALDVATKQLAAVRVSVAGVVRRRPSTPPCWPRRPTTWRPGSLPAAMRSSRR